MAHGKCIEVGQWVAAKLARPCPCSCGYYWAYSLLPPQLLWVKLHDFDMCITRNEEALAINPCFVECSGNMANALKKLMDVIEFLRVPYRRLSSRHVKIHTKPLSHMVENWNDVHNVLTGTQYESFLTPDYQK